MTFLECRQDGRTVWIGPFAKALDARAWLRRHERPHRLRCLKVHERRAKVLFAAYEHGDTSRCVGVFEETALALAAAGRNGVVINWRREDCLGPDDPLPLQRVVVREPRTERNVLAESVASPASPIVSKHEHLAHPRER